MGTPKRFRLDPQIPVEQLSKLRKYRQLNKAPVDTMGCEYLADPKADPATFRFQTLVALMLSSQTKDPVTAATMKAWIEKGLSLQSVLETSDEDINTMISKVGFHNKKTM